MKFPWLVLANCIIMALLGYLEYSDAREARTIPLLFIFLGVIILSLNNTIIAGNKSATRVALVLVLLSITAVVQPILHAYERYHMGSVYRYVGILTVNIFGLIPLLTALFTKNKR